MAIAVDVDSSTTNILGRPDFQPKSETSVGSRHRLRIGLWGTIAVASSTELAPNTVRTGILDLQAPEGEQSQRVLWPGAGRKQIVQTDRSGFAGPGRARLLDGFDLVVKAALIPEAD